MVQDDDDNYSKVAPLITITECTLSDTDLTSFSYQIACGMVSSQWAALWNALHAHPHAYAIVIYIVMCMKIIIRIVLLLN